MDFFLHSSTARYSQQLLNIEKEYGLAGLGFYWKAIELLMQSNTKVPLGNFQALRYKQIGFKDCLSIMNNSGLFHIDENKYVTLAKDVNYGIDEKSLSSYFDKLIKFYDGNPNDLKATRAGTRAGTPAGDACTGTPTDVHPGVCAGTIVMDKKEESKTRDVYALLQEYMDKNYPHLQQMEEPIELEQFQDLQKNYSREQIEDVLQQMENSIDLNTRKRSCYLTALAWLKNMTRQAK